MSAESSRHARDAAATAADHSIGANGPACISRRDFLLFAGATTVSIAALDLFPGVANGMQPSGARMALYPRKRIGRLSSVKHHEPTLFHYPYEEPHCNSILVRLDTPAGGGVGPDKDIVAFNQLCTHQGGLLEGQYQSEYRVLGPCPLHLTTFDLTRHGMVVAGHATEGLPQVILAVEGDEIFATGMLGLMYGYSNNRAGP